MTAGLLVCLGTTLAEADPARFGPFQINSAGDVITLDGRIDQRAALNFRRAIAAAPHARWVHLNSPGGLVTIALLIADDLHRQGLSTFVTAGSQCYSACSYIFFAGRARVTEGDLGVHQISSDTDDLEDAQITIADIIDLLNQFGTPPAVLTAMFRTPPNQIHVFTPREIVNFGINRSNPVLVTDPPGNPTSSEDNSPSDEGGRPKEPPSLALPDTAARFAVYAGLDFYGGDIGYARSSDVNECASQCLSSGGECRAFTFNSDERRSGPNCFLKHDDFWPDGNTVATSGLFLDASTAAALEVGVIDPKSGLAQDVDIPFKDLSPEPAHGIDTAQECRRACVADARCAAFTYVKEKRQCWLKSSSEGARRRVGMVSGAKVRRTYQPAQIIEFDAAP